MKKKIKFIQLVSVIFATTGLNANDVNIDFYGSIRVDAIAHDAEFNNNQAPILVQKQPAGRETTNGLTIHPRLTRLGMVANKSLGTNESITGEVEVDFQNGGSESRELLRLRHAYIDYKKNDFSILVGQTWQIVSRLNPTVNADTLMWGAGNTGDRSPQIRLAYKSHFQNEIKTTIEVGVQQVGTVDNKGQAKTNFGDTPAFEGRIALQTPSWTQNNIHLALGGHKGKETLAEKGFGKKEFEQYGIFTELELPITNNTNIRGEYFKGKNISDLRGGILFGVNPITDEEVETTGYWIESTMKASNNILLSLGLSADKPNQSQVSDGFPSLNESMWGTIHYTYKKDILLGLEYIKWATEYKNDQRLVANRVNGFAKWSF